MKLTGKAKIDFEEWYLSLVYIKRKDYIMYASDTILNKFYREIGSMQWGVYQDWFDSVGIVLITKYYISQITFPYAYQIIRNEKTYSPMGIKNKYESRLEARSSAIDRACEIYNNK